MVAIIKNIKASGSEILVTTSCRHFMKEKDIVVLYGLQKNTLLNSKFSILRSTSTSFTITLGYNVQIIEEPFPLVANYYAEQWKVYPVIYRGFDGSWKLQNIENWRTVELGSVMSLGTFYQITVFVFEQAGNLLMLKMANGSTNANKPNTSRSSVLNETYFEPQFARADSIVLVEENFLSVHKIKSDTSIQTFTDSFLNQETNVIHEVPDSFLNNKSNVVHEVHPLTDNLANPMANLVSQNPESVMSSQMLKNLQTGLVGHIEAEIITQLGLKQSPNRN